MDPVPLSYEKRPRLSRRTRRGLLLIIVGIVIAAAWPWCRPYWRQAKVVWDQRKLTHFSVPPDTIAFTHDPAECDRLLADSRYVWIPVGYVGSGNPFDSHQVGFMPRDGDVLFPASVLRRGLHAGKNVGDYPIAFLHMRRAGTNPGRLVHVKFDLWWEHRRIEEAKPPLVRGTWKDEGFFSIWMVTLSGTVFELPTFRPGTKLAQINPTQSSPGIQFLVPRRVIKPDDSPWEKLEHVPFRLYFGQPDPADESRFTIRYDCDGTPGIISGQLMPDDTVVWKIESGPLRALVPDR